MCISTVKNQYSFNKSHCSHEDVQVLYYNSWSQMKKDWTQSRDSNCTNFVSIILKELDVTNVVREIRFNFSTKTDVSDININESQFDFPNTMWIVRPTWEVALKSSIMAPVVIFGIIMNVILLTLLIKSKWLHTSTNLLIGNMALADLCTLIFCPWMLLVKDFYQNYELGEIGCKVEGFLAGALLITSVMNLLFISYDRLTAIVIPQEARLSRRVVLYLALSSWAIGIIFAMPLSIWRIYKERQWLNFLETYCIENVEILPTYWHVLIFILVWIPLIVMTVCYSAIFYKLDRYEQQILRREHPICVKYKTRVAKIIFAVLLTFIVCRTPFTVLVFWRNRLSKNGSINSVDNSFLVLWFIAHVMIYLNCAINPLIYGLTNESYRKAFVSTSLCKWFIGNGKTNKDDILKEEKNQSYLKVKCAKGSNMTMYHKYWFRGGKMSFDDKPDNNFIFSHHKKSLESPVISSKITPILNNDYI